jgi:hypothetical protein
MKPHVTTILTFTAAFGEIGSASDWRQQLQIVPIQWRLHVAA